MTFLASCLLFLSENPAPSRRLSRPLGSLAPERVTPAGARVGAMVPDSRTGKVDRRQETSWPNTRKWKAEIGRAAGRERGETADGDGVDGGRGVRMARA